MDNIVLYSTHCPMCEMLKRKLDEKGIRYIENNDIDEMRGLGITSVPVLKVKGEYLDSSLAMKWIKSIER